MHNFSRFSVQDLELSPAKSRKGRQSRSTKEPTGSDLDYSELQDSKSKFVSSF